MKLTLIILTLLIAGCCKVEAQSKAKPDTMIILNNNIRSTHGEPQYAQWSINDKIQYNPFSATNIIDANHKIWVKIPQDDTIIRIHHMGRFIILSQSIKNGSFEQIAARDTDGTWIFNKNSSIAMNALYFWITHIRN